LPSIDGSSNLSIASLIGSYVLRLGARENTTFSLALFFITWPKWMQVILLHPLVHLESVQWQDVSDSPANHYTSWMVAQPCLNLCLTQYLQTTPP
jgi:hypothetical protein